MPATAAWLASAEALLNRGIDGSTQAAVLARRLEGTALQVDIEGITRIRATVAGGRLALMSGEDSGSALAAADATISGSPPALWQLVRTPAAVGRAAQIRGDGEIANLYREMFSLARPDPEEELSRWIGDFPARRLSQFARRLYEATLRARRTAGENIAEYLQEEGRDLVNRTELEEFLRGVDELRETADRVEVRLGRLEQRLGSAA
jgi:ubiquinone biosynthesis protein UbiJ